MQIKEPFNELRRGVEERRETRSALGLVLTSSPVFEFPSFLLPSTLLDFLLPSTSLIQRRDLTVELSGES